MDEWDFECVGRFIYGALRYGAGMADIARWMADDLSVGCPDPDDERAMAALFQDFLRKYRHDKKIQENYARFIEWVAGRRPSV